MDDEPCGGHAGMVLVALTVGFTSGVAVSYRLAWRWLHRPRER